MNSHSVNELLKAKEDLTRERDEQLAEIVKLRESLTEAANSQQKAEQDKVDAENKIAEVGESEEGNMVASDGSSFC